MKAEDDEGWKKVREGAFESQEGKTARGISSLMLRTKEISEGGENIQRGRIKENTDWQGSIYRSQAITIDGWP